LILLEIVSERSSDLFSDFSNFFSAGYRSLNRFLKFLKAISTKRSLCPRAWERSWVISARRSRSLWMWSGSRESLQGSRGLLPRPLKRA